ncbi:hypothetical protein K469DRAFT_693169 [Zopfia rhizophila CBS 207.26]|uniref:Zn(2)-C6 fungal-type domain-containing protein n=1 Tax=Zopfia rhizophila CBS 207.26 TaxID=1314779 RepID=A0A6A6EQ05_9PEZI|nr:hypothetical protein K469DRAFT_693169 [Zopfia rhizophila CBS 207.26]
MVFTGKPSRGCITCKKRRIKCDETRPICQRCAKRKVECAWKDEWASMVRHQEEWAQGKVAKRVERVAEKRRERDRQLTSSSTTSSNVMASNLLAITLLKQCQIGPEVFAINRFYNGYVFTSGTCPFLYRVAPLYQSQIPNSLHNAVPAVALASSAKQLGRHDLMAEAHRHYGRALRNLAKSLSNPELAKNDATLLTVFFLGLYEFITTDRLPGFTSPWHSHGPGRLALLRLRGKEQLHTKLGRNLFTLLYHEQLMSTLLGNGEPMDEFPEWTHEVYPSTTVVEMELIIHKISCLISYFKKVMSRPSSSRKQKAEKLIPLLRKGIVVNDSLEAFHVHNLGTDWPRRSEVEARALGTDRERDLPPDVGMDAPPETLIGISRRTATNIYRAVQIQLLETMLAALSYLPSNLPPKSPSPLSKHPEIDIDPPVLKARWTRRSTAIAEYISSSIPYALGSHNEKGEKLENPVPGFAFRGYLMLLPLKMALGASRISEETKEEIRGWLKHIGEVAGIGMAGRIAGIVRE